MSNNIVSKIKPTCRRNTKDLALLIVVLLFFSIFQARGVLNRTSVGNVHGQSYHAEPFQTDWWPMMRHDARRTGYSDSPAPDTNFTLWTHNASGYFAVADGMVFISSGDTLCALNVNTGEPVWSTVTPFTSGSVAVAYNMVYIQDSNGVIYALDEYSGILGWNATFGTGSPAVADGFLFAKNSTGAVACFNATTGGLTWKHTFGNSTYSNPAVADGMVFTATWNEGTVYALNESDGSQIWQSSYLTWSLESTPVVAGGKVYMGGGDRMIYVLDESNGTLIGTYGPVGGYLNQGPVVAYGKLFVGTDDYDRRVYAINETSGDTLWSYYIGGTTGAMIEPRVADHKVFVGSLSSPPALFVLNESNGELIWSFKPPVTGAVTDIGIANKMAFAGMGDTFYAFGAFADVAVVNVTPYKTNASRGFPVNVSVTVANQGSHTESFKLAAYYNLSGYTRTPGPVGYWKADEGVGTMAYDSSGYNNDGTLYNHTAWADGKSGTALDFDGVDDCVGVPDSPSLDVTNNITVEVWVNPRSYGKTPDEYGQYHAGIVSKANAYSLSFIYSSATHTQIQFFLNTTATQPVRAVKTDNISLALNQWHHIAGVYDGNNVTIYLDGSKNASRSYVDAATLVSNDQALTIGWDNYLGTSARRFDGLIDEVRIYNRTLERPEILADMPYYGEIASQNVTLLRAESATIIFTWNTTDFAMGNYTITVCAEPVPDETDKDDNTLQYGILKMTIPGDVSGDYTVGPYDFALLSKAFGSKPGNPKWNPDCDIDSSGNVGSEDFARLSANFGKKIIL